MCWRGIWVWTAHLSPSLYPTTPHIFCSTLTSFIAFTIALYPPVLSTVLPLRLDPTTLFHPTTHYYLLSTSLITHARTAGDACVPYPQPEQSVTGGEVLGQVIAGPKRLWGGEEVLIKAPPEAGNQKASQAGDKSERKILVRG